MQTVCSLFRHEKSFDLALDWKPLYAFLSKYHLNASTRSICNFSAEQMYAHQTHLVKLIAKCRKYFVGGKNESTAAAGAADGYGAAILSVGSAPSLSAGEEVLSTFIPFLSPFDNSYFKSQALLCLFFPSQIHQVKLRATPLPEGVTPGASLSSFHQLFKLYTPFTDNLIDICPLTIILNFQLYARMAKHGLGVEVETDSGTREVMSSFLSARKASFFSTFLQILELDIGNKHSQNMHRQWTNYTSLVYGTHRPARLDDAAAYFAKLVIYSLHYGQQKDGADGSDAKSTQDLLTSLLYTLRTYYHPSNTGKWTGVLAILIDRLTEHYCKRLGREIRGEVRYDRKYFLDPNNLDFLLAVQPIAMQGLYSKSPTMISACESSLRNLASFFPQHILPLLVSNIEQSLVDVNTSHRMMSSLQVMTSQANIIFSTELNIGSAGGAQWLSSMLQLCLPGIDIIDPMKTSFTMTWLAILFYILPLVDAREGGGASGDAKLPAAASLRPSQRFSLEQQHPTEDAYADAVENARSATMMFEDWSLAYVDVLVKLLASTDKYAKKDALDTAFAHLLYKNTRAFFSALSPSIYELVLAKLLKIITGEHFPSAQKQYGILVHTLSLANSELFLAKFVPALTKKIVVAKDNSLSPALAASELEWYVYLLGQAVKQAGGAAACADATKAGLKSNLLLPYIDSLQIVHSLTRDHESKSVRKMSGKLLRNLLKGLTFTYPAEWKNFSPIDDWAALNKNAQAAATAAGGKPAVWKHWTKWGIYTPRTEPYDGLPQIDAIWHVPSAEEMKAAAALLTRNMQQPLQWLTNWIDGKVVEESKEASEMKPASSSSSVGKSDSPLERNLWSLISMLRGVQTVMGSVEGAEHNAFNNAPDKEEDFDQSYTDAGADCAGRCPIVNPKRTQPVAPFAAESIAGLLGIAPAPLSGASKVSSLRTHLIRIVHQAFVRLRALSATGSVQSQPSTKAHVLLLKLTTQVLDGYGCNSRRVTQNRTHGRYSRLRLRELLSGYRCRLRPMLMQKLYDVHQTRLVDLSYNETYTLDIDALVHDLHASATNDFAKVRGKASNLLIGTLRRYPQAIDLTLDAMLAVFSNPTGKNSDETLQGALGVLIDYSMTNWISRKWVRIFKFLRTFIQNGERCSKDDKVQLLIQHLFNSTFPSLQMKTVAIQPVDTAAPIPKSCAHLIDGAKVARRNVAIGRYNKKLSRTYMELMSWLHTWLTNGVGQDSSAAASSSSSSSSSADDKPAHWRYMLMAASFFFQLSRAHQYSTALAALDSTDGLISYHHFATFFLRGTTSSLAPLRAISFLAINKMLGMQTLQVRSELNAHAEAKLHEDVARTLQQLDTGVTSAVDPAASLSRQGGILTFTTIDSEQEQLATVFYDTLGSGWMGDVHNTITCKYFANTTGKHENCLPFAYFTPLSLTSPQKYPYRPLTQAAHTPVAALAAPTLQAIFEFYTANGGRNLQLLSEHFIHAHPTLAVTNEGGQQQRSQDGAGEQITALVVRNVVRNKIFPVTRFNAKSNAFSMIHVNLIRGLVESFPQLLTSPGEGHTLLSIVTELIKTPDEADKACTCAEIICGIMLATKHFRFELRTKIEQIMLPVIMSALQTVQPDCLDHYGDSLRQIYTNMDPRRVAWLSKALFLEALHDLPIADFVAQNAINATINPNILDLAKVQSNGKSTAAAAGGSSSPAMTDLSLGSLASPSPTTTALFTTAATAPSVLFKRLRFLLPILIEVGFRGTKLGEWLVTQFKIRGYLASPWKQVREEVSWILFILTRNEFQLYANHPAQSPGGRNKPSPTLSVLSSPVYLQFIQYCCTQFELVKALYREDHAHPAGSPKLAAVAAASGGGADVDAHVEATKNVAKVRYTRQMHGIIAVKARRALAAFLLCSRGLSVFVWLCACLSTSSRRFVSAQPLTITHCPLWRRLWLMFSLCLLCAVTWFHATSVCGDMVFTSTFYQAFLPFVLWAIHHPDAEVGQQPNTRRGWL